MRIVTEDEELKESERICKCYNCNCKFTYVEFNIFTNWGNEYLVCPSCGFLRYLKYE